MTRLVSDTSRPVGVYPSALLNAHLPDMQLHAQTGALTFGRHAARLLALGRTLAAAAGRVGSLLP